MPLTVKQIEAARFGVEKERLSDGGGLYLRLFPNGAKRFQIQVARAPGGKTRGWVTLGQYPDMSLKAARGLAARVHALAEDGLSIEDIRCELDGTTQAAPDASGSVTIQPKRRQRQSKAKRPVAMSDNAVLLRDAARRWFENKRPTLSNGKHIDQNWNTIATYVLPLLGDRPVAEIKRREVVEALRSIWHEKNTTARRTLGRLKEIIELARLEHDLEIANPADFCTRTAFGYTAKRTEHHAALAPEEMPDFWHWLQGTTCDENIRIATQLLVLTAKRTGEVRFAEWSLIDMSRGIWTSRDSRMKSRKTHRVPLSKQARMLLDNAAQLSAGKRLVFAKRSTTSGTISENAILGLVKRFKPDLTGHGFRASFKTWARLQRRFDRDAVEYALAHVASKLEEAYMRDDLLAERAELMQDWADYVTGGTTPRCLREQIVETCRDMRRSW